MCSLRFENNFLSIYCVRFALKIIFFNVGRVRFALETVFLLSNMFASLRTYLLFYRMSSLRFENNLLTVEAVRFASISKKTPLSKLSFAFVLLALPLLLWWRHLGPVMSSRSNGRLALLLKWRQCGPVVSESTNRKRAPKVVSPDGSPGYGLGESRWLILSRHFWEALYNH